jgi:universal stress protein E
LIISEPHHGRRFLPLLHFNDWELLRRSPIPVLLVKHGGVYEHPVILAAVDPSHHQDQAAGLDLAILDVSQTLAAALGGQLHTVHAYTQLPNGMRSTDALDPETAAALNRKIASFAQQRYAWLLRRRSIPKRRRYLVAKPAVEAIEATAHGTRSAIVTLGVIARGAWQRLLIGGTAEAMLDRLRCDLLVLKPPNFKVKIAGKTRGPNYVALPIAP